MKKLGLYEHVLIRKMGVGWKRLTMKLDTGAVYSRISEKEAKKIRFQQFGGYKSIKTATGTDKRALLTTKLWIAGSVFESVSPSFPRNATLSSAEGR